MLNFPQSLGRVKIHRNYFTLSCKFRQPTATTIQLSTYMYTYMYCIFLQQEVIATLTFSILLTFDVLFAFLRVFGSLGAFWSRFHCSIIYNYCIPVLYLPFFSCPSQLNFVTTMNFTRIADTVKPLSIDLHSFISHLLELLFSYWTQ